MRLVMIYNVGDDCTYSCEIIKPIEYESKEKAILDFGSKLLEVQENFNKYSKADDLWQNRYNSISSAEKKMKVYKERPERPTESFSFGGQTFYKSEFVKSRYDSDSSDYKEYINEPEFKTLDEWFKQ